MARPAPSPTTDGPIALRPIAPDQIEVRYTPDSGPPIVGVVKRATAFARLDFTSATAGPVHAEFRKLGPDLMSVRIGGIGLSVAFTYDRAAYKEFSDKHSPGVPLPPALRLPDAYLQLVERLAAAAPDITNLSRDASLDGGASTDPARWLLARSLAVLAPEAAAGAMAVATAGATADTRTAGKIDFTALVCGKLGDDVADGCGGGPACQLLGHIVTALCNLIGALTS